MEGAERGYQLRQPSFLHPSLLEAVCWPSPIPSLSKLRRERGRWGRDPCCSDSTWAGWVKWGIPVETVVGLATSFKGEGRKDWWSESGLRWRADRKQVGQGVDLECGGSQNWCTHRTMKGTTGASLILNLEGKLNCWARADESMGSDDLHG